MLQTEKVSKTLAGYSF